MSEQNPKVTDSCNLDCFSGSFLSCGSKNDSSIAACIAKPPASEWALSRSRRLLDITISLIVLLLASVPMLLLAACVRLTSKGDVIFSQARVGVGGRLFKVYKFRSMAHTANEKNGPGLTKQGDDRITPIGRLMRKFKFDELPQFYNVLRGDMSLVGPRPKLPQYAALLNMPYRPGITGPATLVFHHEEEILRNVEPNQMDSFYAREIKPVKARLDACYMCHVTPLSDVRILGATALGCLHLNPAIPRVPAALIQMRPMMSEALPPKRTSGVT
jgi:lipopolysaccharide/colanic/teichoic acid biosynthesis glycosyltransferase